MKYIKKLSANSRLLVFLGTVILLLMGAVELPGLQNMESQAAPKRVASVSMNYNSYVLRPGKSVTLKATCLPKSAKNRKVSWKSSKKSVATVSGSGKVTARKSGTARITATAKDGSRKSISCTIKVTKKITKISSIKISGSTKKMTVGKKLQLKTTVSPKKATLKTVYWKSSNTSVATVTQKGSVKAIKAGKVKITALAQDGSRKSKTYSITVSKPVSKPEEKPTEKPVVPAAGISVSEHAAVRAGRSLDLAVAVTPSNVTNGSVQWYSENNAIAAVSGSGRITGVSEGVTRIGVKTTDGSNLTAFCTVTVLPSVVNASVNGEGYFEYHLDRNAQKFRKDYSKPGREQTSEIAATDLSAALWNYTLAIRNGINSNREFYNFMKKAEGNSLFEIFGMNDMKVLTHAEDFSSLTLQMTSSGKSKTATFKDIKTLAKENVIDKNGHMTTCSKIQFQVGNTGETFQLSLYSNGNRIALYVPSITTTVEAFEFYLDNVNYQYVMKMSKSINIEATERIPSFLDFRYLQMYNMY